MHPLDGDRTQYTDQPPEDPFFDEKRRTLSVEERHAREVAELRRQYEELEKARQSLEYSLEEADEVLAERGVLLDALEAIIRRHPHMQDEVLAQISDERLRTELRGLLQPPPPPDVYESVG
jgi:hypothetical protein